MSIHEGSKTPSVPYEGYGEEDRGFGWVMFAGVLLLLLGTLNVIEGIGAIGNAHFFVHNTNYMVGSLKTWGWIALCIGVLQLLVGVGVFAKNQFSRWIGVVVLCGNVVAQLLMIPAYPFWSLTLVAIDVLAIYGLVAYGRRIGED
jgi:nicotinamide riboside transporter PnuC